VDVGSLAWTTRKTRDGKGQKGQKEEEEEVREAGARPKLHTHDTHLIFTCFNIHIRTIYNIYYNLLYL